MKPIYVDENIKTDEELLEFLHENLKSLTNNEDVLCVLLFSANWCNPCSSLKRTIYNESKEEGLSTKYKENVKFFYIDTDKNVELSELYEIKALPTSYFIYVDKNEIIKLKEFKSSNSFNFELIITNILNYKKV